MDPDDLPSVEQMPVLPPMRDYMDVDLAVNENGRVYVFFNQDTQEELEYAMYDMNSSSLQFIASNGRMQDIGMVVHEPLKKHMQDSTEVTLIYVKDKEAKKLFTIPLMIQGDWKI